MSEVTDVLNDREKTYGEFAPLAKAIQAFKAVLHACPSWPIMTAIQREVMEQDIVKNCRIMYGSPMHMDNWRDKAGYATLAVEEFHPREGVKPQPMVAAANPKDPVELIG